MAINLVHADSRGRMALGKLINQDIPYTVEADDHGVITLSPVAAVLTTEQMADLQADPVGYLTMMERARTVHAATATASDAREFLSQFPSASTDE